MKLGPLLFLIVTILFIVAIVAAACTGGSKGEEPGIRRLIETVIEACNRGDTEMAAELQTSDAPGCPLDPPNTVEITSVEIEGDSATATVVRTDRHGNAMEETLILRKEGLRWLVHSIQRGRGLCCLRCQRPLTAA